MTRPTRFTRLDRENYETLFAYAASSVSRRVRPDSAHRHHADEGQGIPRSRARRVTTAEAPVDRSAHESADAPSLARRSSTQRQGAMIRACRHARPGDAAARQHHAVVVGAGDSDFATTSPARVTVLRRRSWRRCCGRLAGSRRRGGGARTTSGEAASG